MWGGGRGGAGCLRAAALPDGGRRSPLPCARLWVPPAAPQPRSGHHSCLRYRHPSSRTSRSLNLAAAEFGACARERAVAAAGAVATASRASHRSGFIMRCMVHQGAGEGECRAGVGLCTRSDAGEHRDRYTALRLAPPAPIAPSSENGALERAGART